MSLAAYQTRIDQIAQVPTGLFAGSAPLDYPTTRDACFTEALKRYSQKRPRHLLWAATPTQQGVFEYLLPPGTPWIQSNPPGIAGVFGIEGWNEDQFAVERIIYPFGYYYAYQRNEIQREFWMVYKKPDGNQYLQFFNLIPAVGFTLGIYYTAPHAVADISISGSVSSGTPVTVAMPAPAYPSPTAGWFPGSHIVVADMSNAERAQIVSTIPGTSATFATLANSYTSPTLSIDTVNDEHPVDFDALCHLAVSYLLTTAANLYADRQKSPLKADGINYGEKSSQFQKRAEAEKAIYDDHMKGAAVVAGDTMVWAGEAFGGADRIFKRKIWTT